MHQTKKENQLYHRCAEVFAYGMKVHVGVDKDTGQTPAAELLHGEEEVVYADAGYQGIEKRQEMEGMTAKFRIAMRPGKRRALPDTPDGRLENLVETALAAGFCSQ